MIWLIEPFDFFVYERTAVLTNIYPEFRVYPEIIHNLVLLSSISFLVILSKQYLVCTNILPVCCKVSLFFQFCYKACCCCCSLK